MRACWVAILSVALCGAAGCRREEPGAAPGEKPPVSGPASAPASAPPRSGGQAHFDAIVAIRDAVVAGDLDEAKAKARWILDDETLPNIPAWRESAADIKQWAAAVANAPGIEPAAAGGAELAKTCGKCHSVLRVSPDILGTARPAPPLEGGTVEKMRRHQWAAERMWEGLVGPSEERWTAGVAELVATPLLPDEIEADPGAAGRVGDLAATVHALGEQARGLPAQTWDTRAAMYGRYMATCAACHLEVRRNAE